jgi:hypothetical protein
LVKEKPLPIRPFIIRFIAPSEIWEYSGFSPQAPGLSRSQKRSSGVQIDEQTAGAIPNVNKAKGFEKIRVINPKALEFTLQSEYPIHRRTPMPSAVKGKNKKAPALSAKASTPRKSKFQADLAPSEDSMVRVLKAELQMSSNTDFLSDALALFRWAVSERKRGHRILSESSTGERKILIFPRLERVAPEVTLPHVDIRWTDKELGSLAELAAGQPAEPTDALIRAMRR